MPGTTKKAKEAPKKIAMTKSNIKKYGYDLVRNFEPAARKKIVHMLDWYYRSEHSPNPMYLGYFLDSLDDIYTMNYLPECNNGGRRFDDILYEDEYKKLPKKYRGLFKKQTNYTGYESSRNMYIHSCKWIFNKGWHSYPDRPEWTVILRNKADKDKFIELRRQFKQIWASHEVYNMDLDLKTMRSLRNVALQLASITTVKYLPPLWKKDRDNTPDYVYQEYRAEKAAQGRILRMMNEKHRMERDLHNEYLATKEARFITLQRKFNIRTK